MLVLDVCSGDRHFMDLMLQKQRSRQQGPATAGQSGAAVGAVVLGGGRRRLPKLSKKRKRKVLGEVRQEHLFLLWRVLKKELKVTGFSPGVLELKF